MASHLHLCALWMGALSAVVFPASGRTDEIGTPANVGRFVPIVRAPTPQWRQILPRAIPPRRERPAVGAPPPRIIRSAPEQATRHVVAVAPRPQSLAAPPTSSAPSAVRHGWPLPRAASRITSDFGPRVHPVTGAPDFHAAIDIAAPTGTPVLASAPGMAEIGEHPRLGRYVRLTHGDGSTSLYGHLESIGVRSGQRVGRGQIIGRVGQSGRATGPHLDYSLEVEGRRVNPITRLARPSGRG